jgi:hypothetical protein
MTPPQRLIESEGPGAARELLRAGAGIELDPERQARLWAQLQPQVGPAGGEGPPAGAGAGGLATKVALVAGIGVLWVGAWIGGNSLGKRESQPTPPVRSAPVVVASASALLVVPEEAPQGRDQVVAPPVSASARVAPVPRREKARAEEPGAAEPEEAREEVAAPAGSTGGEVAVSPAEAIRQERLRLLRQEAEMTRASREALRAGNGAEALRRLEQIRVQLGGRGELHQEREALLIEALWRTGQRAEARARAEAFRRAFPGSPHAANLEPFTR